MKILNESTEKCLVCLEKATHFSGHVQLPNGDHIIAGFCDKHSDIESPDLLKSLGCHGAWDERFGRRKFIY
jgi:hypothetical protein